MERVGGAFVVAPAEEMQRVGRLDIVLRGPASPGALPRLQDGGGADAARLRREEIDRALERLRAGLAKWSGQGGGSGTVAAARAGGDNDQSNDQSFVAAKQREVAELQAERRRLEATWTPPPAGNYLVTVWCRCAAACVAIPAWSPP
jgi:hypothetical protein